MREAGNLITGAPSPPIKARSPESAHVPESSTAVSNVDIKKNALHSKKMANDTFSLYEKVLHGRIGILKMPLVKIDSRGGI